MAEVKVVKQPKQETTAVTRPFGWEPLFEGSLFNVNPFAIMRQFTEDMDRMFGAVSKEMPMMADWKPAVEVKEEKGRLIVKADLPGVKTEDVKVSVMNGMLTLEGERKEEKEEKREGYYHSERGYGSFYRSIALPEGAKTDMATAQFNNGVLEIAMPIPEAQQKRKEIPIQEAPKSKAA